MKNKRSIVVLILAAGRGKRLGASKPKPLFELLGKSSLQYVLQSTKGLELDTFVMVSEESYNLFEEVVKNAEILRQKSGGYGTGYAVISALDAIDSYQEVLILQGDDPLIAQEDVKDLLEAQYEDGVIQVAESEKASGVGRVKIMNGYIESIEEGGKEGLVNVGRYLLPVAAIKEYAKDLEQIKGEYRFTDLVNLLIKGGNKISCIKANDDFYLNMNTPKEALAITKELRSKINFKHLESGVFIDVDLATIGPDVLIAPGAVIEGASKILGDSSVEKGAHIVDSTITDSKIDTKAIIERSVVVGSKVGANCKIGPFAQLRRGTLLDEEVKIGNFVEIKASSIGRGTKINHHAYIGDSSIGEYCNIGCGVITANYDGKQKHHTEIGAHCFIGSNSVLVAPVTIRANSFIAAGSTITHSVPPDSFSIARSPQVTKIGGAKKYLS